MTLRRLLPWLLIVLVILVVVGGVRWWRGAEDRRVAEACETWLQHQGEIDSALMEIREALGRARSNQAEADLLASFNDSERVLADLDSWVTAATEAAEPLEGNINSGDASTILFSVEAARDLAEALREGRRSDVRLPLANLEVLMENLAVQCAVAWRAT